LCYCGLDYSGREAFFEEDRRKELEEHERDNDSKEEEGENSDDTPYYQANDPYVPKHLYDPSNALVYCDGCNRLYHQKCHFVPLMTVPRGNWNCLVCTTKNKVTCPVISNSTTTPAAFTKARLKRMFQAPPSPEKLQFYFAQQLSKVENNNTNPEESAVSFHSPSEKLWELETRRAKSKLWFKTLTQSIPSSIQTQIGNFNQAQTALETLTRTKQNRMHFLDNSVSKRGSQELAQTLVKMCYAKYRMRQIIQNLDRIRTHPDFHCQQIRQWCQQGNANDAATNAAPKPIVTTTTTLTANDALTHSTCGTTASTTITKSFMERIIFPFGRFPARSIPRTAEYKEDQDVKLPLVARETGDIPCEITTTNGSTNSSKKRGVNGNTYDDNDDDNKLVTVLAKETKSLTSATSATTTTNKNTTNKKETKEAKDDASSAGDSSSGVSLDDAKCCICFVGDATDDNDLLLCDGLGCCRSFHMECLEPKFTLQDLEGKEDEDWFCPLCSGLAECMHMVQSYYMGEEWDRRREERAVALVKQQQSANKKLSNKNENIASKKNQVTAGDDDDDNDSLKSWDRPDEVFPRAQWEYETALQLRNGKQNDDTKALLQLVLGSADSDGNDDVDQGERNALDDISDGTDDEEIDGHFDLEAFHEERRRLKEAGGDGSDNDSSHSSAATLVDMSSVELKIGKDELDCLEDESDSSSHEKESDDSDSEAGGGRRSRRLRKRQNEEEAPKKVGVDFDPTNIVQGKRRRTAVDYRKLNDSMFGSLDDSENAKLDDKEDFRVSVSLANKSSSSDEEDSDDDSDSDSDSESRSETGNKSDRENDSTKEGSSENEKTTSKREKKSRPGSKPQRRLAKRGQRNRDASAVEDADSGTEGGHDSSVKVKTKNGKKAGRMITKDGIKPAKKNGKTMRKKASTTSKKPMGRKSPPKKKRHGEKK